MDEIRNYRGSTPLASKLFVIRYLHKLDRLTYYKSPDIQALLPVSREILTDVVSGK